jgi:hypothetical protein
MNIETKESHNSLGKTAGGLNSQIWMQNQLHESIQILDSNNRNNSLTFKNNYKKAYK